MTLRFFGRATRSTTQKKVEPVSPPPEAPAAEASPAQRRTRRGRRGSGATKKSAEAAAKPVAEIESKPTEPPKPASRTRRGRRGGVGRKPPGEYLDGNTPQLDPMPEPAPVVRRTTAKAPSGTIEGLLARQEAMIEQQLAVLKGVEGTLSAIETRLATTSVLGSERQRVGIFVDVPNIMYAAERLRTKVDYAKMLSFLVRGRELVRASAYSPISDDLTEPIAAQKFVHPFMGLGYAMITKPLKRYADGTIKANFDVELAIDILTICERLDVVILVSGDGDFRRLVELVCSKGVRVEVAAFGDSTAAELRSAADQYIDLEAHLPELRTK